MENELNNQSEKLEELTEAVRIESERTSDLVKRVQKLERIVVILQQAVDVQGIALVCFDDFAYKISDHWKATKNKLANLDEELKAVLSASH